MPGPTPVLRPAALRRPAPGRFRGATDVIDDGTGDDTGNSTGYGTGYETGDMTGYEQENGAS
ncbi:hypothetical protein [Streptomyces sp. NPDC047061]|uniref:hypothetical protein n=1 Tax=Streptomyces sp. NPDC047061 TaxID=3154605 RepID=UPI00340AF59F